MEGYRIGSFEDVEVYQKLYQLHMEINEASLKFSRFEMYELGSLLQILLCRTFVAQEHYLPLSREETK